MFCGCQMWPLFISLILILFISALTNQSATTDIIIYGVCLVGFFTWIAINLFSFSRSLYHGWNNSIEEEEEEEDDDEDEEMIMTNQRWRSARTMAPRLNTHDHIWVIGTTTIMAEREQYRNDMSPPFGHSEQIAQMAIRTLPPVKSFGATEDKNNVGSDECPICMENFKDGELIQPFGLCFHEFHSSCLNSWLHGGNTTCPVCREDLLSISIRW